MNNPTQLPDDTELEKLKRIVENAPSWALYVKHDQFYGAYYFHNSKVDTGEVHNIADIRTIIALTEEVKHKDNQIEQFQARVKELESNLDKRDLEMQEKGVIAFAAYILDNGELIPEEELQRMGYRCIKELREELQDLNNGTSG